MREDEMGEYFGAKSISLTENVTDLFVHTDLWLKLYEIL